MDALEQEEQLLDQWLERLPQGSGAADVWLRRMHTPLGTMLAGAAAQGVVLLEFADAARLRRAGAALRQHFGDDWTAADHPWLRQLEAELSAYFNGRRHRFEVPLVFPGTPLQQSLWQALTEIPHGERRSYEQMAAQLGVPGAVRAIGTCNGINRLAIVVPCHRLVNKDGRGLGGYGGGLWRKQRLLELESAISVRTTSLSEPPRSPTL
ncbi:methylated-DNA--[protein]-cysteine S-methyltransferase [Solimonas sp. SE-A11]|uniref:methylated-DNA--[protein]-cysteine S-methyltransferase n=1 Tax=Solimonas sp. SE-A11 TaxID=3054954 RepID=UPI00259CE49F|nr:methylated-DNA--[protein]-cysteine S-methyltransferase [Solimonas sp. SE-A11]MDM4771817.1 methylated-DNA--[protein]-cysteine S-methyltransferase [Solimonas sp. SE-A11]